MKRGFKAWVCALGVVALAANIHASINPGAVSDTPYSIISVRNVFDLREVPTNAITSTNPVTPPLNVKLTGLTTIFGYKQGVFAVTEPGKQPVTIVLAEGERQNGVELVSIDMQEKTANIKNDDRPAMLRLDEKGGGGGGGGAAAATASAPNPALGGRGIVPPTQGGGNPFAYGGGGARGPAFNAGTASAFNPQGTASALPAGTAVGDQVTTPFGGTIPSNPNTTRPVRTDSGNSLTPEQIQLLVEAQRAQALQNNNPGFANLLPPTPMTPSVKSEFQNDNSTPSSTPPSPISTGPAFNQPKVSPGYMLPGGR